MQERWVESELLSVLEAHLSIAPVSGSDVKQEMSLKMEVGIDKESSNFSGFISNTGGGGRGADHRSELLRPPRLRAAQSPPPLPARLPPAPPVPAMLGTECRAQTRGWVSPLPTP